MHTVSVMFSHVFPAVGIQNVKVQREFWKRFGEFADSEEDREGLGCHLGQGLWMPTAVKLQRRRSKAEAEEETSRAGCCVNVLRTVGPCGGSEVKHYINTVQFLAQTDCFVSLDLNVSSRAAGFYLVLSVYGFFSLSKPWVPLTVIIWLKDCNSLS